MRRETLNSPSPFKNEKNYEKSVLKRIVKKLHYPLTSPNKKTS